MKYTVVALLSLASAVMAFESTVPCIMWSPKNYIDTNVKTNDQFIISQTDASSAILSSLSSDICSAKVIALINQPMLHSNDLTRSNLQDAFTQLKEHSTQANSGSHIEYIAKGVDVYEVAKMIASGCNAAVSILDPSTVSADDIVEQGTPIVAVVPLPEAYEETELKANDALLGQFIDTVQSKVQDDYAVIYTSSEAKTSDNENSQKLNRRAPAPVKNLPIFAKYQLFTPGVFMVLGVVLLFLFIAGTGITWLVGIQTPVRFEAKQKKN
ncbi:vacuolar ATP synthase subunit S1-domain-containing protein [Parasitella parasitica]|nr:vacuolar ATP synthase subunit S1-domain-containing protein [Parasitella parasitica]